MWPANCVDQNSEPIFFVKKREISEPKEHANYALETRNKKTEEQMNSRPRKRKKKNHAAAVDQTP